MNTPILPSPCAAVVAAMAAAAFCLGLGSARADTLPVRSAVIGQPASSPVTRAQVKADFLVWRAAGMPKWEQEGADLFSASYKQDLATYLAVRSSPQFAMIQGAVERGQVPGVVISEHPLRVTIAKK